MSRQYRAERRNHARQSKMRFPWPGIAARALEPSPIRPNERDREKVREAHITMDFTDGVAGISRALINRAIKTVFPGKPKRGWAAAWRRAPFREFFADDPEKLEAARMRHVWYRKQKTAEAMT